MKAKLSSGWATVVVTVALACVTGISLASVALSKVNDNRTDIQKMQKESREVLKVVTRIEEAVEWLKKEKQDNGS